MLHFPSPLFTAENVPVPHDENQAMAAVQSIMNFARRFGDVDRYSAYSGRVGERARSTLNSMGFHTVFCGDAKEAADKAIITAMLTWLWDQALNQQVKPTLILITSDNVGRCRHTNSNPEY